MQRIFDEHKVRIVKSLDGLWNLTPDNGSGKSYPVFVPSVWERIPDLTSFRGVCTYKRSVEIAEPGTYLLKFGGVSHTADVYLDGQFLGHHYNAFTAFQVLAENVTAGSHTLTVVADNRFSEKSALHVPNDYTTYGGINRPVELHKVEEAYIDRMAFSCEETGKGKYLAHVSVFLRALSSIENADVLLSVAGGTEKAAVPALSAGESAEIKLDLAVRNVVPWDVLDAHLYDLTATLSVNGQFTDDLIDRVGFRTVKIEGERILLNGKEVRIKGFNRHEDHGQFGMSLSVDAMMDDLQLILDTGANSLRSCHYPNDPRFLDLCDALGLLVWEENHARQLPSEVFRTDLFREQCRVCNEEMVHQHCNHPGIYIWGLLNECESDTEYGRTVYAEQIAQLRALDPTRPISFASCRKFTDICLDLVEVVSYNIYPRWYEDDSVRHYTEKLVAWMEEHGAKTKPILITEIGAGGIYGYHDPFAKPKWSEERQAEILEEQLTAIHAMPRLSGAYLWQFADVKVADEFALRRPKAQNNKGIVDLYRRPKLAYLTVKKIYHEI